MSDQLNPCTMAKWQQDNSNRFASTFLIMDFLCKSIVRREMFPQFNVNVPLATGAGYSIQQMAE